MCTWLLSVRRLRQRLVIGYFSFQLVSIKTHTNVNTCMRSSAQTHTPPQDSVRFVSRIELRHVAGVARRRSASAPSCRVPTGSDHLPEDKGNSGLQLLSKEIDSGD